MEDSKQPPDLEAFPEGRCRMILIGKTGAGKSATANTILGRHMFQSQCGINSETKECGVAITVRDGLEVLVMDTPGLCDTDGEDSVIATRITQSLFAVAPGPHAVLLVLRCDARFTDEEVKVFETLKHIFGLTMTSYLIIIFVGKDKLDKDGVDFEKQLQRADKLKGLLKEASDRYLLFNNEAGMDEKAEQVEQLLLLIRKVAIENNGDYFRHRISNQMDRAMSKMVKEEIRNRVGDARLGDPRLGDPRVGDARVGDATADVIRKEERSDSQPERPTPSSNPDDEHSDGEEADDDDVTFAAREAVKRRQEVQHLKGKGTVKARLHEIQKRLSADTFEAESPKSPAGSFRSPRSSLELKASSEDSQEAASATSSADEAKETSPSREIASAETSSDEVRLTNPSQKIASTPSSPDEAKQITPEASSFEDKEITPDDVKQTNVEILPPFEGENTKNELPKNLVWEWSSNNVEIEKFLDQLQDELSRELTTPDDSPFIYEIPDKPGMTTETKRRLVEDSLRRKIISRPETLNDVQKEELEKAVKSVGQKVKEGMTKFAVKTLDRCLLM